jgi:hypothetical protein
LIVVGLTPTSLEVFVPPPGDSVVVLPAELGVVAPPLDFDELPQAANTSSELVAAATMMRLRLVRFLT